MLDLTALLWHFLAAQPPGQLVRLVTWHLLAVLFVLGLLSAFGLHFLLGHVFGFYKRKGRVARWVAWPTLLVWLVSLQALLGIYLLGVQAPAIVHNNLTADVTSQLGRQLLEPAFNNPVLAAHPPDAVPKAAIKAALHAMSELDYRAALQADVVPPGELAAAAAAAGHRAVSGQEVLVQLGLRWITEAHNSWYAPSSADAGAEQGEQPFFLPDFLASLVDELQKGTVLPRLDWEHVAGTRFVDGVLRPVAVEYLSYLAGALAIAVLLLDALYFLIMRRLRRIGQPRQAPAKAAAKGAPLPAPAKGSAPDVTPAKSAAQAPATPAPAPQAAAAKADAAAAGNDGGAQAAKADEPGSGTKPAEPAAQPAEGEAPAEGAPPPEKPTP